MSVGWWSVKMGNERIGMMRYTPASRGKPFRVRKPFWIARTLAQRSKLKWEKIVRLRHGLARARHKSAKGE